MTFLALVLLSVTACATVTPGTPAREDRPQGVHGPALPDRPTPPGPAPSVTQRSQRSALVRTGPGRERDKPQHTHRPDRIPLVEAPVQQPATAAPPQQAAPQVRPAAPQRPAQPRVRPRPATQVPPAPKLPPTRPHPQPQVQPEQMRDLCRRADGVAPSGIADLCHQMWG